MIVHPPVISSILREATDVGDQSSKNESKIQRAGRRQRAFDVPPLVRKTSVSARAVGSFVPRLTKKAMEKFGFSTAALLTDWAAIVGSDLARYTRPHKLKWPRAVETYGDTPAEQAGRPGATLYLQVDAARALDVQYKGRQIIDRINAYFGYRAIADLRIEQVPMPALEKSGAASRCRCRQVARSRAQPSISGRSLMSACGQRSSGCRRRWRNGRCAIGMPGWRSGRGQSASVCCSLRVARMRRLRQAWRLAMRSTGVVSIIRAWICSASGLPQS